MRKRMGRFFEMGVKTRLKSTFWGSIGINKQSFLIVIRFSQRWPSLVPDAPLHGKN
jgi:hypothetical protein